MLSVNDALSKNEDAIGIGRKGTIDKPYLLSAPFWTVGTLFYAVPRENMNLDFVFCLFQNIDWKSKDESTGVPSLSKTTINKVDTRIPSPNEQVAIGSFFSTLDTTITLHQRKLELLKELKKAYLQNLFPENGKKIPRVRFSDFTEDWEQRRLGEIGKTQSGIGFPDNEQGGLEGVPFFKVSDMNNTGNEHEMKTANNYVSDEQLKRKNWKPIETVPAIMFAKVGAAIMLNRKRIVRVPFLIDNNTMAYVFGERWDTDFGKALFETINLPRYAQVGALPSYNGSDIENVEIKIPTMVEQAAIGSFFATLDRTITFHQRKLEFLQQLKKSYLHKMFI